MKRVKTAAGPFLEIGQCSIKVLFGDKGLDLEIERSTDGLLAPASRQEAQEKLRAFLGSGSFLRGTAICAIPARGVSLRHFVLPRASREETRKFLTLQIEKDFPLPLTDLGWGYKSSTNGVVDGPLANPGSQEVAVAAVRRVVLEDYRELLTGLGFRWIYCLSGIARSFLCEDTSGHYGILEVGRSQSELALFDDGKPLCLRTIPWRGGTAGETPGSERSPVGDEALDELAGLLHDTMTKGASSGLSKFYITGEAACMEGFTEGLAERLRPKVTCQLLEMPKAPGVSAATLGLRRHAAETKNHDLLTLVLKERVAGLKPVRKKSTVVFWVAAAVLLGIASLLIPYLKPLTDYSNLEAKLQKEQERLAAITRVDNELNFLRHVDAARAEVVYLDLLAAIATAAPEGTFLSKVSINRQGDVALHGTTRTREQVNQLRHDLQTSGLFTLVVPHEITPVNEEEVTFRLSVCKFLHAFGGLGYPLVLDSLSIGTKRDEAGTVDLKMNILVVNIKVWKDPEERGA